MKDDVGLGAIHVYHHFDLSGPMASGLDRKLDTILATLTTLATQETQIMADLTDLTAKVQATTDAEQSAILLINGIAAQLKAAGTDPAALAALGDSLKTNSDALAAAVVANTPVA